jgi:hypothetical protein
MSLKDIFSKEYYDKLISLLERGVTVKVGNEHFTIKKVLSELRIYDFNSDLTTVIVECDNMYEPVTHEPIVKSLPLYGTYNFISDLFLSILGEKNVSKEAVKMIKMELNKVIRKYNYEIRKYKRRDQQLNHTLFKYILPGAIFFIDENYKDNMINLSVMKCDLCNNTYDINNFIYIENTYLIKDYSFYIAVKHLNKDITNIDICHSCYKNYKNFLEKRQMMLEIINS